MEITVGKNSWLNLSNLLEYEGIVFWDQTEYPVIPFADGDRYLQLNKVQAKRIDLLAFQVYGDAALMWVLQLANEKDYPDGFIEGETIRIPAKNTVDQIFDYAKSIAT